MGAMTSLDWAVVFGILLLCLGVGLLFARLQKSGEGFFTANRSLSWWAVGISNSATYQSGLGAFVTLIFFYGLAGNWLWWLQWIIWMPLVAIIWSRMWRRMRIVTTAELIQLRYGGQAARLAQKIYAASMFLLALTVIAYIAAFFAKTINPLVPWDVPRIMLVFGVATAVYTIFGGLMGSVMVAVVQMVIMIGGSLVFMFMIIPQFGGWEAILARVLELRPNAISLSPVSGAIAGVPNPSSLDIYLSMAMFIVLGLFFAGSPTAGEGMTAQRFMAARSERHAIGGQLFNAFIALSLRIVPLVGLGIIAMTLFWHQGLTERYGFNPEGLTMIEDPAYVWGELIKASHLPAGLVGLLVATEIAAFMSTLSALINWGSSFLVNDFYKDVRRGGSAREELWGSRATSLAMFILAAAIAILFVDDMIKWFLFINSVVVIFWLPLAYFRFFWARFNVWGEIAATTLSLPLGWLVWFTLDFQSKPFWMGTGLLFTMALLIIVTVTLLTPPESDETLTRFYKRCRPMIGFSRFRRTVMLPPNNDPPLSALVLDCVIGMLACLGLVMATNAIFVRNWPLTALGMLAAVGFGGLLIHRSFGQRPGEIEEPKSQTVARR